MGLAGVHFPEVSINTWIIFAKSLYHCRLAQVFWALVAVKPDGISLLLFNTGYNPLGSCPE